MATLSAMLRRACRKCSSWWKPIPPIWRRSHCVARCASGARIATKEGHLGYDARYCVGCGACEAVCPRNAIALVEATFSDLLPEGPGKPAIEPNLADYE